MAAAGNPGHKATAAGAFLLLTLAVTPSYAQDEASRGGQLEEIVVTSQRRAESLQDVPASVAAYGEADITRLAISSIEDVMRFTPGLAANNGGGYSPILSIRGISSAQASTTGIYLDDTPIQVRQFGAGGANLSAYPAVFDLERIEVLRGPQGTLFGAGSEGGAVRFITPQPSFTGYSGHTRAEFGFNSVGAPSYQFGSAFGGPLLPDRLAFRVSAYVQEDGGWIDRRPYPSFIVAQKNINSNRTTNLNVALAWAVTDTLTVTPKLFFQNRHSGAPSAYWRGLSNPSNQDFIYGGVFERPTEDQFVLPSLKIEWRAGSAATLISNTSYMDRTKHTTEDNTFVINEILTGNFTGPKADAQTLHSNPQQEFTQEIRLQSADSNSALGWVVGAFYQTVDQEANHPTLQPDLGSLTLALFGLTVQQTFGVPILPDGDVYLTNDTVHDSQKAAFAQVDVRLWDKLTVTGGFRYSKLGYSYTNVQGGPFNGGPSGSSGSSSSSFSSPKIGLDYKPFEGLMFYASAAKGFRPGAANVPVASLCAPDLAAVGFSSPPLAYDPDQVWSYEVGAKGNSLQKRFLWDASAYRIDWSKRQTGLYLPGCGQSIITNIGTAISKGFDFQGKYAVSEHLTIEGSLGYDDAHIAQTVPIVGRPQNIVTDGEPLNTPPWHGFVSAEYEFAPLATNARVYIQGDDSYSNSYRQGSVHDRLYDPAVPDIEAVNILSARIGIRRDTWDASLFTKNLLNAHPIVGLPLHVNLTSTRFEDGSLAPRVIGIRGVYRF